MAVCSAFRPNCSYTSAWSSVSWILQRRMPFAWRSVRHQNALHRDAGQPHAACHGYLRDGKLANERNTTLVVDNTFLSPTSSAPLNSAPTSSSIP